MRPTIACSIAITAMLHSACEAGTYRTGGGIEATTGAAAPDLRTAERALLNSSDWETIAVYTVELALARSRSR